MARRRQTRDGRGGGPLTHSSYTTPRDTTSGRGNQERDRWFESGSLRRPVCLTSAFHAYRRKDPAFAGSVSLDETRERDVLAPSRLALTAFL